jgi:ELWxxDGT repeat protein
MKTFFGALLMILTLHSGFSQQKIGTFQSISATQAIGDKVFFTAFHTQYGSELFVTDAKTGEVRLVKDIAPGGNAVPGAFTVVNNQLFFTANTSKGLGVWKTDGSPEGTQLVYGVANTDPGNLIAFKGKLYFTTYTGAIMRTDGTPAGTEVFYQANFTSGRIMTFQKSGDYLYFTADGKTIFRDDGSSRLAFTGPLSWEDVSFRKLIALENHLVVIKTSTYQNVIRMYAITHNALNDNLEDEWTLIKKLDAPLYGSQELDNITHVSGKIFFSFRKYYDNVSPADELWICNGTEAGTKMVKSFPWDPHLHQSETGMFFNFNGKLFFRGGNSSAKALWTSDGTSEGTVKLHDVVITPPYNDDRLPMAIAENKFYFSGSQQYNAQLWISDGTAAGTQPLLDVEDDAGNPPYNITIGSDAVFFVTSGQFSSALWSTHPAPDIAVTTKWNSLMKSGSILNFSYAPVAKGGCTTMQLNIQNKGQAELYLGNVQVTGRDFYLVKQSVGEMIAPGQAITLQVVFNPVNEGESRGTLSIASNDVDETKYIIQLKGTASNTTSTDICAISSDQYVKILEPLTTTSPITLSANTIAEEQPAGTTIGTFSFSQAAAFTLTTGEGDSDNSDFYIEGNKLKSNTKFNFDLKSVYSLRVRATSEDTVVESSQRIHILNGSPVFSGGECRMTFEQMSFSYTSLEVNPQGHLFVTTTNGKILRSTDAGLHWEVVYSGPAHYYGLSGLTFIGNTGFARSSAGIFKSDDGGTTWFQLYLPLTGQYYFSPLSSFFLNDEKGYVGTSEGEIFFTNDGGRTWKTRLTESWNEFQHLFFVSENKGYAISRFGDLLQTVDGGHTWLSVNLSALGWNPRVQDVWFIDDKKGFLATYDNVYSSSDGGQTWVTVSGVNGATKIKFYDALTGYLYGGNGMLYKTSDGGKTWKSFIPGMSPSQVVGVAQTSGKMFIANKDYYYSDQSARSLAVSSDEGATWSALNYYPDSDMYQIRFTDAQKGIVIGEYGLFRTTDNGLTWNHITMDIGSVADLYFINENTMIFLSGGDLYKSSDGGATTKKVLATPKSDPYLPAGKLYGFSDDVLFSVSWYAVYRSVDLGETWELVSSNPGHHQRMHFISSTIGYLTDLFGTVEKSLDGGKTWSKIFISDPEASDVFTDIFFVNEKVGYSGGDYLRKTTDGGLTWKKIDWPFYDIIRISFKTEDHGYVVVRNGAVYETTDGGITWQTISHASTKLFAVQFHDNGIFVCGENGFSARMNTTPGAPSLPGYISGPERVCVGDAAEFYVASNTYATQWTTTAKSIGDNNQSITITFPQAGEYTVSAAHFNSCGVSESRTITVMASGHSNLSLEGPSTVASGEENVMYTVVNGNENAEYLWDVEGNSGISVDGNSVAIDWSLNAESGVVKVLEVDRAGCRAYDTLAVVLAKPVSIEEQLSTYVHIYPNPSQAETHIASAYNGPLHIRITDTLGKKYFQLMLSKGEQRSIHTQHLPAGLYFVEISDGTRKTTHKLIKE